MIAVLLVSDEGGTMFQQCAEHQAKTPIGAIIDKDLYLENRARCEMFKLERIPGGYCIFCNPSGRWETETG